jgi:hypothetical protein
MPNASEQLPWASPALILHPPDPRTLMQKAVLEQRPPPPSPIVLPPLAPPHVDPLVPRIGLDIVIHTLALHPPERGRQVDIPRQIQRLCAAEGGLETQADFRHVALTVRGASEVVVEGFLVDALVVVVALARQCGRRRRASLWVRAHHVHDVVEDIQLFGQGSLVRHVVAALGAQLFREVAHDAGLWGC